MRETEILRGLEKARAKHFAHGTPFVHGKRGKDKVPAMLTHGEAVLPVKTVRTLGAGNIARLIADTNNGKAPKRGLHAGRHYAVGEIPDVIKRVPPDLGLGADPAPTASAQPAAQPAQAGPQRFTVTPENQATLQQGRDALGPQRAAEAEFRAAEAARVAPQGAHAAEAPASLGQRFKDVGSAMRGAEGETLGQRAGSTLNAAKKVFTGGGGGAAEVAAKPGLGARALGGALKWGGAAGLALGEGKGVMDAVNDSADTVKQRVGMGASGHSLIEDAGAVVNKVLPGSGLDFSYDGATGRTLANAVSGAGRIGDGVTGGLASKLGEGIVRLQNGQNFFEPSTPTTPVAQPAAPAAVPAAAPTSQQPGVQPVAASTPEARTLADAVNKRTYMPPNGGGVMVNNSTGAVTKFNPPQPAQPGAPAEPKEESIHSLAERFGNARTLGDMLSAKAELHHRLAMDPAMAGKALGYAQLRREQMKDASVALKDQVSSWSEHNDPSLKGDEQKAVKDQSIGDALAALRNQPITDEGQYKGMTHAQVHAINPEHADALAEQAHTNWRLNKKLNASQGKSWSGRGGVALPRIKSVDGATLSEITAGVPIESALNSLFNPVNSGKTIEFEDGRKLPVSKIVDDQDLRDFVVRGALAKKDDLKPRVLR